MSTDKARKAESAINSEGHSDIRFQRRVFTREELEAIARGGLSGNLAAPSTGTDADKWIKSGGPGRELAQGKRPELSRFGLTPEQLEVAQRGGLLGNLASLLSSERRALERRAKAFLEAEEKYRDHRLRSASIFWKSLSGLEFERELTKLFRTLGLSVSQTHSSGDKGVDIMLRHDDHLIVVQCKRYERRVGPSVVRELIGTIASEKATFGILACTGGFTPGAISATLSQPISLMSLEDVIELQQIAQELESNSAPPSLPDWLLNPSPTHNQVIGRKQMVYGMLGLS